jgi:microcystin-dependent protein
VHIGSGFVQGQIAGTETVTLTVSQIPQHSHSAAAATGSGGSPVDSPSGNFWSGWTGGQYSAPPGTTTLNSAAIGMAGGNQPHDNMAPFLTINFVIALYGIYPSQT